MDVDPKKGGVAKIETYMQVLAAQKMHVSCDFPKKLQELHGASFPSTTDFWTPPQISRISSWILQVDKVPKVPETCNQLNFPGNLSLTRPYQIRQVIFEDFGIVKSSQH